MNPFGRELSWVKDSSAFRGQLERGRKYQILFAQMICSAGIPKTDIVVGAHAFRENYEDRKRFRNEVDLVVCGQRIEIKSRNFAFRGPEDYPHQTAFVDTVKKWNGRKPKPLALALVSQFPPWGVAIVFASTEHRWTKVERFDRVREFNETFYQIDKSLMGTMTQLVEKLVIR